MGSEHLTNPHIHFQDYICFTIKGPGSWPPALSLFDHHEALWGVLAEGAPSSGERKQLSLRRASKINSTESQSLQGIEGHGTMRSLH